MMNATIRPIQHINGEPLNDEQRQYLDGFFTGLAARGLKFSDVEATPAPEKKVSLDDLIFEERVKRELHPLDAYPQLLEHAAANQAPEKENIFRFKWNGLFYLTPNKEAFMARLRIPGGLIKTFQLREIAAVAKELTSGYVQVTTRANLQLRLIKPKDAPELLRRIQSVGLHTRGAGADNIRNLTANPTAGLDPQELIDTLPLCQQLGQIILNDRSFYDLPRKFHIALDGGGLISTVEDTNDIGLKAVRVEMDTDGVKPGVYFRVALGGATGHKAFARDLGVLVEPEELLKVTVALVRVYITNGNRADRKRARLKHLLESWSLEKYLEETEKLLGYKLHRCPSHLDPRPQTPDSNSSNLSPPRSPLEPPPHPHVGVHPQKQAGLNWIGVAV